MEQNNNNTERKIQENYYLLLDLHLDPPVTDKEELKKAIEKKRREWNDGTNSGRNPTLCKKYCENIKEIEDALLTNDEQLHSIIKDADDQLTDEIYLMVDQTKSIMNEAVKKAICKKYEKYYKEETIRKKIDDRIKTHGGPKNGSGKTVSKPPDLKTEPYFSKSQISITNWKQIKEQLYVLNKKDIYAYFECPITTSVDVLNKKAAAILANDRKKVKRNSFDEAAKVLAGIINIFTKADKDSYDVALKFSKVEDSYKEIFALRIINKTVSWESYRESIENCRQCGLSKEEAEWYVWDYYIEKKKCPAPIIPGNTAPQEEKQYCKFCGTPSSKEAKNCSHCGKPLKIKCPKCGREVPFDSYCSCGFNIGNMAFALDLYDKAKKLLLEGKHEEAYNCIKEALLYWSDNEVFIKLLKEIEKRLEQIEEERRRKEKEAAKVHLRNINFSGTLAAEISGELIKLNWPNATVKDQSLKTDLAKIKYRVVRKENALSANIDDGVKLSETTQLTYEDDKCVEGIIYAYAVYPVYDGEPLESGLLSKKVIRIGEITNLTNESDDKEITLKWKNPVNIIGVHCVRKKGSVPRNKDDGEQLPISGKPCSYSDRGLENKTVYGYRIMAKYQGPEGIVFSAGAMVTASPDARPTPLDIKYVIKEKEVDISWTPKSDCDIKLYYSSEMPSVSENSFISETSEVFNSFQSIKNFNKDTGKCLWKVPGSSGYYIIPAAIRSGKALIGKIAPVMPCITKLSATKIGSDLHVTWTWPSNCENVLLVWRSDKQPESVSDEKAVKNPVPKRIYDRNQAFIIKDAASSYYISVYTFKVIDKDQKIYSTPQTYVFVGESRKMKLTYSIVKKFFSGTFLNIQASSGPIPKLTLISLDRVPLSKNINAYRGGVSQEIPATNESALSIKLSSSVAKSGNYIKLFFSDPEDENQYVIEDPLKNRI